MRKLTFLIMIIFALTSFSTLSFAEKKQKIVKEVNDPTFKGNVKAAEHYQNGNNAFRKGDYQKAISEYQASLQLIPDNYKVLYAMGLAYKKMNNLPKAVDFFQQAAEKNPQYEKAFSQLGATYLVMKKFKLSYDNYKKASELKPKDYRNFYGMAKAAYFMNKYNDAIENFKKVLSLRVPSGRKRKVYELLIRTYLDANKYSAVISTYEEYPANKRNKRATFYYGEALYRVGKKKQSLKVFQKLGSFPGARQWVEKIKKEI